MQPSSGTPSGAKLAKLAIHFVLGPGWGLFEELFQNAHLTKALRLA